MLTMSTLMMPAPTITTMTNPGPIPIAQHTKLEPKFVFTTNHNMTMIQQKPGKSANTSKRFLNTNKTKKEEKEKKWEEEREKEKKNWKEEEEENKNVNNVVMMSSSFVVKQLEEMKFTAL
ncbi:hypothetical protein M8J77_003698 [Diaphorina citri]|nr:hypothetical protein M8J77_003698 [Diaphorina citri]